MAEADLSKLKIASNEDQPAVAFSTLLANLPQYTWLGADFENGDTYFPALLAKRELGEFDVVGEIAIRLFDKDTAKSVFDFSDEEALGRFRNAASRLSILLNAKQVIGRVVQREQKRFVEITTDQMMECLEELLSQCGSSYLTTVMERLVGLGTISFPAPAGVQEEGEVELTPYVACYNAPIRRPISYSLQDRIDRAKRAVMEIGN